MSLVPPPGIYVPGGMQEAKERTPRKALFLDRDGVINVNHGYVCSVERTDWVPGIFELCAAARGAGYVLIVVTNQAGIARGYYSEADFLTYTEWVHDEFLEREVPLLATYYCPHHPTSGVGPYRASCICRKPGPGMILAAVEKFSLIPEACLLIGDKPTDIEAGRNAGISRCIQVSGDLKKVVNLVSSN